MKITDEKGKLFGKINLIDLLVLVLVAAALILLAVRFLLPSGNGPAAAAKLTYTAQVQGVDQATYDEVMRQMENAGGKDQLMANGELVDGAYVTKVEATPHVGYNVNELGEVVRDVEDFDGGRWDLLFTVEADVADVVTNKVGTQEVRVAKSHILKTAHFEFGYSLIMSCDWE